MGAGIAKGLTANEVATGEVGDGEQIAVSTVCEHKLGLVIGGPEIVELSGDRECCPLGFVSPRPAVIDESVPIESGMDGADGRLGHIVANPPAQLLADFGSTPARVLPLDREDFVLNLKG